MGEPVAVVVAESDALARKACKLVRVDYAELPAVFDPEAALEPGAPEVNGAGNLCSRVEVEEGDLAKGFAEADLVIEETFTLPRVSPAYMETEVSLAEVQPDGSLMLWVSSQNPFGDKSHTAQALGIADERVCVRVPRVGGAFGGKEDSSLHMLCGLAAWKIGGAVSMANSREESLAAHPRRHSGTLHYRVGVKRDGTLTALSLNAYLDTGAYASYGPAVVQLFSEVAAGPYRIPNVRIDSRLAYTNCPVAGAVRGFGAPQANFGAESLMTILAGKLGLDPLELRRRNIWVPGDRNFTRVRVNQAEALGRALEEAEKERARMQKIPARPGWKSGVGVALMLQTMGLGAKVPDDSTNRLEWLPDGQVLVYLGAPDLGQGLGRASVNITAGALGLDPSRVRVAPIDSSHTPNGGVTCASRMTYLVGNSILLAANELTASLLAEAAALLKVNVSLLSYENGAILRADRPHDAPIPAEEIASRCADNGRPLQGTGTFSFPYGPETPSHLPIGMPHVLFCFGADVARVEVDPGLGMVEVTEVTAIHDVGKVVNRPGLEGQIEGGVAMGIGYALLEDIALKPDQTWVDGLSEYLLPTSLDVPPVKKIILEYPEPSGPGGAKGIGEMSLTAVAPAITNAVEAATGKRVRSLPITPEKVAG
jgi:CO/xanthine dehydrogenase Mo-binding subunit